MPKFKVTLTINLEVEAEHVPQESLAIAHFRAESLAARAFLCGDAGGEMTLQVAEQAESKVEPCAIRILTLPGNVTIRRLKK